MTPSHYPEDDGTVRVLDTVDQPDYLTYETQRTQRTAAQRHSDQALDTAETAAAEALTQTQEALDWLASVGAVIPSKLRNLPTLLGQLSEFVADEKTRRQ